MSELDPNKELWPAVRPVDVEADVKRGRAFLERLRRRAADEDWDKAYDALDYVMGPGRPLRELPVDLAAALGRVLREST